MKYPVFNLTALYSREDIRQIYIELKENESPLPAKSFAQIHQNVHELMGKAASVDINRIDRLCIEESAKHNV